jgi:hypothetical protein
LDAAGEGKISCGATGNPVLILRINENDDSRHMEPSFSASAFPDLESGTGID